MYDYTDLESCHQIKETKSHFRKLRYKKIVWIWLSIKLFTSETMKVKQKLIFIIFQ